MVTFMYFFAGLLEFYVHYLGVWVVQECASIASLQFFFITPFRVHYLDSVALYVSIQSIGTFVLLSG